MNAMLSLALVLSASSTPTSTMTNPNATTSSPVMPKGRAGPLIIEDQKCPQRKVELALEGKKYNAESIAMVKKIVGNRVVRWITTGASVTMDYSPSRTNIEVAKDKSIIKVTCG